MGRMGLVRSRPPRTRPTGVTRNIEEGYGRPEERRNGSNAALRAVLHAVRDRLTVGETAQMGVQLPMLVCQAMDITGV
jgi:Uncharacterized conserved protein (DUF2267)